MKTNKKSSKGKIIFSVMSILTILTFIGFMSLNANNPIVPRPDRALEDGIMTSGGYPSGEDHIRQSFEIHQAQVGEIFNDLHFKVWQKEGWIKINGWTVAVSHFTQGSSVRSTSPNTTPPDDYPGYHAVDCDFWGTDIPYCNWLTISIDLWLSDYNTMRVADFYWTRDGVRMVDLPNIGWAIGLPSQAQTQAYNVITPQAAISSVTSEDKSTLVTAYLHEVTFCNDSSKDELLIKGLRVMVSPDDVSNLKDIDFSKSMLFPDVLLSPGTTKAVEVYTDKPYIGDHLYLNYNVYNTVNLLEPVYRNQIVDHPIFQPPSSL